MTHITPTKQIAWTELFQSWSVFWPQFLRPYYDSIFYTPLFISKSVLTKSKYLTHFPHQLFSVSDKLATSTEFVTPAACLHIYPTLQGKNITEVSAMCIAHCARKEGGKYILPYRLPDFHMTELVTIGNKEIVVEKREKVKNKIQRLFTNFDYNGAFERATDAFFLGDDEGAKMIQKLKGLKEEFIVQNGSSKVALLSINYHEDFFGKCFRIKTDDSFSNSFCIAFGLERLTSYSLKIWGENKKNWPHAFKKYGKVS